MNVNVETITKDDNNFKFYCLEIENISKQIVENLAYSKYLRIDESIAISIFKQGEEIVGFSSILHRPLFGNGVRILNRFYKKNNFRFVNTSRMLSSETTIMIKQQIDLAKNLNYDYAFMSREGSKSIPAFMHYKKDLDFVDWNVNNARYKVCDYGKECYQYVMWTPLKELANISLKEISKDEYNDI